MKLQLFISPPPQPNRALPAYTPQAMAALKAAFGYDNVQVFEADEPEATGDFGHAIFMPFKFEATDYTRTQNGNTQNYSTPDLLIPIVIIEAEREKNSEFTPLEGRDGTVEEFGSFGDWLITLKGMVANLDDTYPDELVSNLNKIADASVPVDIACEYLSARGVFTCSVTKIKLVPMPGYENVQAFEMNLRQQNTIYLTLKNQL